LSYRCKMRNYPLRFSKSCINDTSASTPSTGKAL